MVPKNLIQDQKDDRRDMCSDISQRINDQPKLLKSISTCDETWTFQYDPETKRLNSLGDSNFAENKMSKRMSKFELKAMLIVFFDIKGIIMIECGHLKAKQ